ncbi:MAG: VWA domain-containing protein [Pseudomonadota bacterium]
MRQANRLKRPGVGALALAGLILLAAAAFIGSAAAESNALVTCRAELDRGVLIAGRSQRAVFKVTLDAAPVETTTRASVNLSVVLDRSGSMRGEKLDKAIEAGVQALRRLNPKDIFSVVIFDHEVETIVPAQSASKVEWIESRVRAIKARGNTALFAGVSRGAAEVRKNLSAGFTNRIILLSDGMANVGPGSPDDLGRLGAALLKEDISVTTVGVGMDYNEDLMTRLARNSDGNSYFVEHAADIPRVFTAELGDVMSVAAKKVRIIIECSKGVRPVRIIGREGRIKGENVELSMHQLYGGQQKYALVEVEVPEGAEGQTAEIACARVSYENPLTGASGSVMSTAKAGFSGNAEKVEKSANVSLQRDYTLNLNAVAQERAVALADQGKKHEAVRELREAAGRLQEAGQRSSDSGLLEKAAEMEQTASRIEREGMNARDRKVFQTDSFQTKTQQQLIVK